MNMFCADWLKLYCTIYSYFHMSTDWLDLIMETECVSCAAKTGYLDIFSFHFSVWNPFSRQRGRHTKIRAAKLGHARCPDKLTHWPSHANWLWHRLDLLSKWLHCLRTVIIVTNCEIPSAYAKKFLKLNCGRMKTGRLMRLFCVPSEI